ncbi:MAG: cobyric acid synthase [Desulfosudaceae bacterium]
MKKVQKVLFLGTGSDVGKSVTATAFCRILKNRGIRVAPFKAQNMSNNAYVTLEGGEIGRAQAAQAEAAGCLPSVHMNPVLLKPCSETGSQVVVLGQVHQTMPAQSYYEYKDKLKQTILNSFAALAADHEAIVMEGAGSCAEINLRQHDIVNFDLALSLEAPVILVADIDRGGVFAQIVGTLELISEAERDLVAGFIINKFRGDPRLFDDGIAFLEEKTGKPVLGLVPVYRGFAIDTEDSMSLDAAMKNEAGPRPGRINLAVLRLPHVSNFTDIEALQQEPGVTVTWLEQPDKLDDYQALIIPGSKSVIHDLVTLRQAGWPAALAEFIRDDRKMVVGLCGGYQMLGRVVEDPLGLEGDLREYPGLGLLDISTRLEEVKQVRLSTGRDQIFNSPVSGYEIHMGRTRTGEGVAPLVELEDGQGGFVSDGAMSPDGRIFGTYLHGLFDSGAFRGQFLRALAEKNRLPFDDAIVRRDQRQVKDENYDRLAAHFENYVDVERILAIMER